MNTCIAGRGIYSLAINTHSSRVFLLPISTLLVDLLAHGSKPDGLAVELRDVGLVELPGADFVGEEDIQLTVSTALGFGEAEEGPDDAEEVETEPEEAGLGTPAPCGRIQHVGGPDVVDDTDHVVCISGEHDGLGAEASRGQFSDEGVADGADSEIISERVYKQHRSNDPTSGFVC